MTGAASTAGRLTYTIGQVVCSGEKLTAIPSAAHRSPLAGAAAGPVHVLSVPAVAAGLVALQVMQVVHLDRPGASQPKLLLCWTLALLVQQQQEQPARCVAACSAVQLQAAQAGRLVAEHAAAAGLLCRQGVAAAATIDTGHTAVDATAATRALAAPPAAPTDAAATDADRPMRCAEQKPAAASLALVLKPLFLQEKRGFVLLSLPAAAVALPRAWQEPAAPAGLLVAGGVWLLLFRLLTYDPSK
ncbi:hypothetical protein COO60DRAFT_1461404 [Scenedesmus sp. NREL 46B-D3]|nr:hypothetical protein COO60DRAFT_1461404 [Scenedesmus sp. NREL 46B-D3]